jgi:hypothetical protein
MKSVVKYLFAFSLLICVNLIGQTKTIPNSFVIKNNSGKVKDGLITSAITNANMESYRLKDKDVTLHFEEGFDCMLYSAKSLFVKGISIDANSYKSDFTERYKLPIFSISASGILIAKHETFDSNSKSLVK